MIPSASAQLSAPRLLALGDSAWTIEFGDAIDAAVHARVLGFAEALRAARMQGELAADIAWVPTFRSLTVHFDPLRDDALALGERLMALATECGSGWASGFVWRVPVCFDPEFAPDLADVASAKGLDTDAVVRLLTEVRFNVYMLGFLPGFPYLGGLPEVLDMPRLANPRSAVPARSIAIAGRSCAAYPWQSPGGWQLVGRTPIPLFDVAVSDRPALLAPGDKIYWRAVDRDEYEAIESRCYKGEFRREELRDASATQVPAESDAALALEEGQ